MATNKKYIVLADIESVRVPYEVFERALAELSRYGEIVKCKFYGYSAKRTKDYGEFIQENSYDALSALPRKRKGKLDLRQVIDATEMANKYDVDGFMLVYGNGDITYLISYLKGLGKDVVAGVIEDDKNSALCNKVIYLDTTVSSRTVLRAGYKPVEPTLPAPRQAKHATAKQTAAQQQPQVVYVQQPAQQQPAPQQPQVVYVQQPAAQQPAQQQPNNNDQEQMALLLEQFNKILSNN